MTPTLRIHIEGPIGDSPVYSAVYLSRWEKYHDTRPVPIAAALPRYGSIESEDIATRDICLRFWCDRPRLDQHFRDQTERLALTWKAP